MPTEYRFYCPELQREVSTAECYDRGNTGRSCYGELCQHVEYAICMQIQEHLREAFGDRISTMWNEADSTLTIRFHDHLTLEAYYDPLFRTIDFDAYLHITHGHQFPAENVEGLVTIVEKLLNGGMAFVVQPRWMLGGSLRLVTREELQANWRKYTSGCRTRFIDGRGIYTKEEFRQATNNSLS